MCILSCSRRRGLMFMGAGVLAVLIGIIITVTTINQANHGKAGFYAIYISEYFYTFSCWPEFTVY